MNEAAIRLADQWEFVSRIMERLVLFRVGLGLLLLVSIVSLLPYSIAAQNSRDDRVLGESGLPLPRFVAVSEKQANMRRGPGEDYPLLYQYRRQGLPLEVVAEYGQWRQVRDHEGSEGWMHARLLRASRHVIIAKPPMRCLCAMELKPVPVLSRFCNPAHWRGSRNASKHGVK